MRIGDWSSDVCSSDLQAQHLPSQRGQSAVEGIEVVDQELDLGRMELNAFDLGGQFFAQLFVLAFLGRGKFVAGPEGIDALCLQLLEALEEAGDAGEKIGRASCRERVCQYV